MNILLKIIVKYIEEHPDQMVDLIQALVELGNENLKKLTEEMKKAKDSNG